jgi:small subunit ribosomal protein S21
MIIINLEGKMSIEQALKKYKMKFAKHKVMEELKDRKEHVKESVKRRDELKKARYRDFIKRKDQE